FIKSPVLCCGEDITFNQVAKFTVPLQLYSGKPLLPCNPGVSGHGVTFSFFLQNPYPAACGFFIIRRQNVCFV
ncbi:hypothetical protein C9Z29_24360, partial [Escherichia coli]